MHSLLKHSYFLVVAVMAVSCYASSDWNLWGNGQPGCQTEEELQVQLYRNFYDPTAYWVCTELDQPAQAVRCEDGTAYMNSLKECVSWNDWKWETPIEPLSKPKKE